MIEDDSRVARVLRQHSEREFSNLRVEVAGSAQRARSVCEKFPSSLILWGGSPKECGTWEEYAICIPDEQWERVIPISADPEL